MELDKPRDYAALKQVEVMLDTASQLARACRIKLTQGLGHPTDYPKELERLEKLIDEISTSAHSGAMAAMTMAQRVLVHDYEAKADPDCVSPEPTDSSPEVDTSVMLTADRAIYAETKRAYSKSSGKISGPFTPEEIAAWNFIYRNRSVAAGKGDPYFPGVYPVATPHPASEGGEPSGD